MITSRSKSQHISIVPTAHVDDSRCTKSIYVPKDCTSIVDFKSSTPIHVVNILIPCVVTNDNLMS